MQIAEKGIAGLIALLVAVSTISAFIAPVSADYEERDRQTVGDGDVILVEADPNTADHKQINWAIQNASEGDRIVLDNSTTWNVGSNSVSIEKNVTLDLNDTKIAGPGAGGKPVGIGATNVTITDGTIDATTGWSSLSIGGNATTINFYDVTLTGGDSGRNIEVYAGSEIRYYNSANSYQWRHHNGGSHTEQSDPIQHFELRSGTYYTFSGTITNAQTDSGVGGADVTLRNDSGVVATATTASDGSYSVDVPADTYTVEVQKDGYQTDSQSVTVGDNVTHDAALPVEPVNGVIDADGTDVSGATVTLYDSSGAQIDSATTGTNGEYLVQPDVPGVHTVEVQTDSYGSETVEFDTRDQTTVNVDMLADTHTIDGQVIDQRTDAAVEGASVELVDDQGITVAETTTDSSGNYDLGTQDGGDYRLVVSHDGHIDEEFDVSVAGDVDKSIALEPTNVWSYNLVGDGDSVTLSFASTGTAVVTVEAYNTTTDEWETVVDGERHRVNGTSDWMDTVNIDVSDVNATEYRITVEGDSKPAAVSAGSGWIPGGTVNVDEDAVPFILIAGGFAGLAFLSGSIWYARRCRCGH